MNIKELIPWGHEKKEVTNSENGHPFFALQNEMNRMFDDFSKSVFDFSPWYKEAKFPKDLTPKVDVAETEKEFKVTVELPGMEEKDIDVSFAKDTLVVKGEKSQEKEEKKEDCYLTERSYGSIQRAIPVSAGIDSDKIDATMKNGVLKVVLPKTEEAQKESKKIKVNGG